MHGARILATLAVGLAAAVALPATMAAQYNTPPSPTVYALRGVTIVRPDGDREEGVTVIVRRGFIEAIGPDVTVPPDAKLLSGDSLLVYPGMVDAQGGAKIEFPKPEIDRGKLEPWNPPRAVQGFTPHLRAADHLAVKDVDLKKMRTHGVVAGAVLPDGPVMPGRGALLIYRKGTTEPDRNVLNPDLGPVFTFRGARGVYPGTLFGVVAFIRQSFENARHHGLVLAAHNADPRGVSLPEWDPDYAVLRSVMAKQTRVFFAADKADDIRQILSLAADYGFEPVIVGGDEAWRVADLLKARDVPVLVSLDFPKPKRWKPGKKPVAQQPPQTEEPLDAAVLREQQELENIYANPARLAATGVRFSLTSGGGKADIRAGTRKAIEYGLSETDALRAVTTGPAQLLGAPYLTRVEPGMRATFIVTDGPMFSEDASVIYTFVDGELEQGKVEKSAASGEEPSVDVTGTWTLQLDASGEAMGGEMKLTQEGAEFSGTLELEIGTVQVRGGTVAGNRLTFTLVIDMGGETMEADASGSVEGDTASGSGGGAMGDFTWKATRSATPKGGRE